MADPKLGTYCSRCNERLSKPINSCHYDDTPHDDLAECVSHLGLEIERLKLELSYMKDHEQRLDSLESDVKFLRDKG